MKLLIVSSSLDPQSRSERLAELCLTELHRQQIDATLVNLKQHSLPSFDNDTIYQSDAYQFLHASVLEADGLILASPVYNWGCCAELKKFVECVGSTPPNRSRSGAFFDKVVTFVNAAGLPHSYMAFNALAISMLMDFKCVINPYNVYVHERHWKGDQLIAKAAARLEKSMQVAVELTTLLKRRAYSSTWEI